MRFRWACPFTEIALEFEAASLAEMSQRATATAQRLRVLTARPYHAGESGEDRATYPALELHVRWRGRWLHLSAPPAGLDLLDQANGMEPAELRDAATVARC